MRRLALLNIPSVPYAVEASMSSFIAVQPEPGEFWRVLWLRHQLDTAAGVANRLCGVNVLDAESRNCPLFETNSGVPAAVQTASLEVHWMFALNCPFMGGSSQPAAFRVLPLADVWFSNPGRVTTYVTNGQVGDAKSGSNVMIEFWKPS